MTIVNECLRHVEEQVVWGLTVIEFHKVAACLHRAAD